MILQCWYWQLTGMIRKKKKQHPTWQWHGSREINKHLQVSTWLVVFNHLEKYEFVNGKDDIPYMENWKCSKPPSRVSTDTSRSVASLHCQVVTQRNLRSWWAHRLVSTSDIVQTPKRGYLRWFPRSKENADATIQYHPIPSNTHVSQFDWWHPHTFFAFLLISWNKHLH